MWAISRAELPTGTVTFLFTDVEGSTRLLHDLGERYVGVLSEHRRVLREAFARHGGVEVDTQGDAFFVAFAKASEALTAAAEGRDGLARGPIRVRMGLHTGEPTATAEGYVGMDVHRAARIAAAGHGGQILVSQSTRDLAPSSSLRDLGQHRLKDLTAPERIYQFGDEDFPPIKTLSQTNLPVQPTPLVGRERELEQLLGLLDSNRLLTLTGPGGSGKTRLAMQVAAELVEEFPDGVWFVSLAPLVDPLLVLPTVAATIGAQEELSEHLRGKRMLLLLDNLEQVLSVAPKLGELLAQSPGVKLLTTSRERLSLAAEQEYSVPTLPLEDAVELFVTRSRQLDPSFSADSTVGEICRRLDGLPLAVELAAARIKVLTLEQILNRLDRRFDTLRSTTRDAPARQRTLRATIDWSYQLLVEEERALFARLAVFAGSFDLESAEVVAEADLELLESLVDKSLLRRTHEGRLFMLETIREYGLERFDESLERDEIRMRHAQHAVARAESSRDEKLLPWLASIDPQYTDLLAALTWLAETESSVLLLQLASRLGRYWDGRSRLAEGRRWLDLALERGPTSTTPERAEALSRLGHIAWRQGDLEVATAALGEAQAAATELGDEVLCAWQHMQLGAVAASRDDLGGSEAEYVRAIELLRACNDTRGLAVATHDLGLLALHRGDYPSSRKLIQESIQLARANLDAGYEANAIGTLGFIELGEEHFDRAKELLLEALELERGIDLNLGSANNLVGLAAIAAAQGNFEDACFFVGAYDAHRELVGASHETFVRDLLERVLAQVSAQLGKQEIEEAKARGAELSLAEAVDCTLAATASTTASGGSRSVSRTS